MEKKVNQNFEISYSNNNGSVIDQDYIDQAIRYYKEVYESGKYVVIAKEHYEKLVWESRYN